MMFAGGPDGVAYRLLHLHEQLGHTRQLLQLDVGGMPHQTFLKTSSCSGPTSSKIREELGGS
jgi:hypothetical protein